MKLHCINVELKVAVNCLRRDSLLMMRLKLHCWCRSATTVLYRETPNFVCQEAKRLGLLWSTNGKYRCTATALAGLTSLSTHTTTAIIKMITIIKMTCLKYIELIIISTELLRHSTLHILPICFILALLSTHEGSRLTNGGFFSSRMHTSQRNYRR